MKIKNSHMGTWIALERDAWLAWEPKEETVLLFASEDSGLASEAEYRKYDGEFRWVFECLAMSHAEIPDKFSAYGQIKSPW